MIQLTWKNYLVALQDLLIQIQKDKYKPDLLVAIGRGGLFPGQYLSYQLDLPLIVIMAKREDKGVNVSKLTGIYKFRSNKKINVLLVDSIVDTGQTTDVIEEMLWKFKEIQAIKLAAVCLNTKNYLNENRTIYSGFKALEVQDWVHFPWEKAKEKKDETS